MKEIKVSVNDRKQKSRKIYILVIVLIILALITVLWIKNDSHGSNQSAKSQLNFYVAKVDKLIELPTNETPTLATVTNQNTLSKQTFFKNAKNGDKVLLYTNNKLAILYRPSINKLINVGPINGVLSYGNFTVTLRNGTSTPQFTGDVNSQLVSSFPNAKIEGSDSASRSDFPNTIVIPINNSDTNLAGQVANSIGGKIGALPIGESKPNTDLLIIIGQDYSN